MTSRVPVRPLPETDTPHWPQRAARKWPGSISAFSFVCNVHNVRNVPNVPGPSKPPSATTKKRKLTTRTSPRALPVRVDNSQQRTYIRRIRSCNCGNLLHGIMPPCTVWCGADIHYDRASVCLIMLHTAKIISGSIYTRCPLLIAAVYWRNRRN